MHPRLWCHGSTTRDYGKKSMRNWRHSLETLSTLFREAIMFRWRRTNLGKCWIEDEATKLVGKANEDLLTFHWVTNKKSDCSYYSLTISTGLTESTIEFPARLLVAVICDNYIQRRIRRRLSRVLGSLV